MPSKAIFSTRYTGGFTSKNDQKRWLLVILSNFQSILGYAAYVMHLEQFKLLILLAEYTVHSSNVCYNDSILEGMAEPLLF